MLTDGTPMKQAQLLPEAGNPLTGAEFQGRKRTRTGADPLQLSWSFFLLGHAASLEACRKELEEALLFEHGELAER